MKKIFSKKSFAILMAVMLVLQVFVPATAAATPGDYCSVCGDKAVRGALKHTIAATCGEDGFEIYECEYEETVDGKPVNCAGTITIRTTATGVHVGDGTVVPQDDPTCTEKGTVTYEKCKDCGAKLVPGTANEIVTLEIPATGHNYIPTVTNPDCENGGYTTYKCNICNDTYVDNKVDANGHNYVDVARLEPTCHTEGYTAHKACTVCGKVDPETKKEILPIADHNGKYIEAEYVAETCLANGKKVFGCEESTCPYFYDGTTAFGVEEIIDEFDGHDIKQAAKVEATCTEDGHEAYEYCTRGDYTTYDEATMLLPALGHTEVIGEIIKPTCTEEGAEAPVICDRCGFVHRVAAVIPALGHTPGAVQVEGDTTPKCDVVSSYDNVIYCTVCDAEVSRETVKVDPVGHTLNKVDALAADCVNNGHIKHSHCSVCNKDFAYDADKDDLTIQAIDPVIKATGHKHSKWSAPAATCTESGWDVYTCTLKLRDGTDCKNTYSVQTEALGHDIVTVEKVEATCTEDGHEAYEYCKRDGCDYTTDDLSKVIPALGHGTEVDVPAVAPTYDTTGLTAGKKCSVCGEFTVAQTEVARLAEEVKFTYEATGLNGAENTVNSGFVKFNVYMNVTTEKARVYAFNLDYSHGAELSLVGVENGEAFAIVDYNATSATSVKLMPNMGMTFAGKEFAKGKYLVATITFKVSKDFNGTATITADAVTFARDTEVLKNELIPTYDATAEIEVVMLGNATNDAVIDANDVLAFAKWSTEADEGDYNVVYDLNKDGVVDGADFALLRAAAVGDAGYLN